MTAAPHARLYQRRFGRDGPEHAAPVSCAVARASPPPPTRAASAAPSRGGGGGDGGGLGAAEVPERQRRRRTRGGRARAPRRAVDRDGGGAGVGFVGARGSRGDGVRSRGEDAAVAAGLHRGDAHRAGGLAEEEEGRARDAARDGELLGPSRGREEGLRAEAPNVDAALHREARDARGRGNELHRERGLDVVERGEQSLETVRAEDLHPDVHAHGQDALRRVVVQARRAVHAPVLRHQPRLHRRGA